MLIMLLGLRDLEFEFRVKLGVKLVKIDGKLSCSGGCEVLLWVNSKIGVVTFVGKKW